MRAVSRSVLMEPGLIAFTRTPSRHRDGHPLVGQAKGNGSADPATRPGHQPDLARQVQVHARILPIAAHPPSARSTVGVSMYASNRTAFRLSTRPLQDVAGLCG